MYFDLLVFLNAFTAAKFTKFELQAECLISINVFLWKYPYICNTDTWCWVWYILPISFQARGLLHHYRKLPRIPCTLHGLCSLCGPGMWDSGHVPIVECVGNHKNDMCPYNSNPGSPLHPPNWSKKFHLYIAAMTTLSLRCGQKDWYSVYH